MKLNERIQSSAVAAAVAIACGSGIIGVANAAAFGTISNTTVTLARQYVSLAAATHTIPVAATVTLGVAYASGDRIRVSINNASFATSGLQSPTTVAGQASTCGVDALTYDGTVANFRVPAGGSVANSVCVFNLGVRTATVSTSSAVSLNFQSFISGTTESLETLVASNPVITTANQFSAGVSRRFAGVVDVEKDRYHFVGDDPSTGGLLGGFESQLHIDITNAVAGVSTDRAAAVSAVTVTVVGDFSWLDDDGSNSCSASDVTGNAAQAAGLHTSGPSAGTFNLTGASGDCRTLSFSLAGGSNGLSITTGLLKIAVGKTVSNTAAVATNSLGTIEKRIPASTEGYTASVEFSYFNPDRGTASVGSAVAVNGANAGSFTLNGSAVNVPFLPYGTGISRIVYLTNRSSQTGAITFSAIADGSSTPCTSFASGTAKANGVTFLTQLIDDGITACYGANYGGKIAVTITSNTPAASTEVFSGYNRNGSITSVVNSSNGK